ncbi:DUF1800 domain-containing protein [Aquimarina sp. ERC-38]|uniref:DUF1800 domain-containing protein n=1 Tax=Aquimarina sp. ERC-38 TaxID=2949996 RepID=UPI002246FA21|nr:DUF1800 domain-containing protein [Aquimarina sp. ERC-38]UZO81936.1 DUF1800 domain-containing protein [Aquimarina sp. ERC-38]
MTTDTNCNVASLDPYIPTSENPWTVRKINHLYRRIAFGATKEQVQNALIQEDPSALIDELIDNALVLPPTAIPEWGNWNKDQFDAAEKANKDFNNSYYRNQGRITMIQDLLQNQVRDRLTLFWSNHFVTEDRVYRSPAYQFQYYSLLQLHALGNFKDFTYDIGISNAMLAYLNGNQSTKDRPNENYARELYELFTLGVDNGYTETDIQQTAKALTGYVDTNKIPWGDILFTADKFSTDSKSIFNRTGNWGYDDAIDILFEQRETLIANFICEKLYRYFVSFNCNEGIVAQMAQTFINNNFEIAPVLRQLFKSEHFFDKEATGSIIKSPCDLLLCYQTELGFNYGADFNHIDFLNGNTRMLGQEVLNPIDVEGWQGDEDWISPDLLIGRWESIAQMINRARVTNNAQLRDFVMNLPINTLADGVINNSYQADDVTIVVRAILNYFLPRGLEDDTLFNEAVGVFKGDTYPENYYEPDAIAPNIWTLDLMGVPDQIAALLNHIAITPEFQLK